MFPVPSYKQLVAEPTRLKNMLVKLDNFPKVPNENKQCFKPPATQLGNHIKFQILSKSNPQTAPFIDVYCL